MFDPFTKIVALLRPEASATKLVIGSGSWAVRRHEDGRPFYCAVLAGSCHLAIERGQSIALHSGDFVLVPATFDFVTSSAEMPFSDVEPEILEMSPGVFRIGALDAAPDVQLLVGHCAFPSDDTKLLVSLLPQLIHVREERRLVTLVELVNEETRADRPGRDVVLARLLEVLLIEAMRTTPRRSSPPGLLRGLSDERLAAALRKMHEYPEQNWSVVELAKAAALSRSTFFERFRREVGVSPMEYLMCWRMAVAKDLLRQGKLGVAQVAECVGYRSASTFSVAFTRYVGIPPINFARSVACSKHAEAAWA